MANKSCGIFYNGNTALGVVVEGAGPHLTCNFIEAGDNYDAVGIERLGGVARRMSGQRPLALTLGGTMYMSHDHRSEFEDIGQAAQTLRFDIEDTLAVDADNIIISYQEKPTQTSTVDMIVYTASRSELAELFAIMEQEGADPLAALPVAAAWQYYLANAGCIGESAIYVGRSDNDLQLMVLNENGQPVTCRKFPIGDDQRFYDILKLELTRCTLTALKGMSIKKVYYHSDSISLTIISDIVSDLTLELQALPQESFIKAVAIGAALSVQKGSPSCNFRSDDMEPVSIKKDRNKAWLVMSALVCAILLSWICWNLVCIARYNDIKKQTTKNIIAAAESCGVSTKNFDKIKIDMEKKLVNVRKIVSGNGAFYNDSASNTFNLMLNALSRLNTEFDIVISSIAFKPGEIKPFSGSVPDLEALQTLRQVLTEKNSGLQITQETSSNAGERQSFDMPLISVQ